jgi:hypothetical protein
MKELIISYHQKNIIPVLNQDTHQGFLVDYISGYLEEGFTAIERFAASSGFRVIKQDYRFRYAFYPSDVSDDSSNWPCENVPVDVHSH